MGFLESVLIIFSLIGVFDTLYISYHASSGKPVKCWFFPERQCKKVQYSKFSTIAGIPNGYLGFVLYCEIILLTLFTRFTTMPFWPVAVLVIIGFLFAIYFTIIQAFILRAFCVYCLVSAVNFTVMFISLIYWKNIL